MLSFSSEVATKRKQPSFRSELGQPSSVHIAEVPWRKLSGTVHFNGDPSYIVVILKDAENPDYYQQYPIDLRFLSHQHNKCHYEFEFTSVRTDYQLGVKFGDGRQEAWLTQHIEFGTADSVIKNFDIVYNTSVPRVTLKES
ncbi:hypothetical protein DdX_20984 [Ditylenchus destructor]|uniref:Uncharacterized protein n=1 Tax=Ditylenchus destructor TaxID=166010 RepID=A0AAD4MFP1_9BILA|nr:hypothetical protein DdX_20984 [Ditylenchus destructor]